MSKDRFSVRERIALVTGASSGIGAHFARVLAEEGARVVLCARSEATLDAIVDEIASTGGEAYAVPMDVTQRASVEAAFAAAEARWGVPDVVCSNAGVARVEPFTELEEEDFDRIVETNLKGVFTVGQVAARHLIAAGRGGSIINTASILAFGVTPGQSAYTASKGGVIQLTRSMALELWRHDIRVNAICPGYFRTEMNEDFMASEEGQAYARRLPARRLGRLEELSGPLLLLASDASAYMSGSAIRVDGCHSIRFV